MGPVDPDSPLFGAVIVALRAAGARFALVFGSTARGEAKAGSDVDIAAWWPSAPPNPWDVKMPADVDLIVIDRRLPLELAGRIALEGRVLFDDDPAARVGWVATTRKI